MNENNNDKTRNEGSDLLSEVETLFGLFQTRVCLMLRSYKLRSESELLTGMVRKARSRFEMRVFRDQVTRTQLLLGCLCEEFAVHFDNILSGQPERLPELTTLWWKADPWQELFSLDSLATTWQ